MEMKPRFTIKKIRKKAHAEDLDGRYFYRRSSRGPSVEKITRKKSLRSSKLIANLWGMSGNGINITDEGYERAEWNEAQ